MKPYSFDKEHDYFFCTDTIVGWQYVFTSPPFFEVIISSFKYCQRNKGLRVHVYVIMPNHVHSVLSAKDHNLSDIVRDYKRFTSESISELLGSGKNNRLARYFRTAVQNERKGNDFKIWQSGSHPEAIETGESFDQKLDYIHENPVRKGFVSRPEDWVYSSARNYYLHDDSVIKVDLLD